MATGKVYQLRVSLKYTKPPIWRKLAVPGEMSLGELHEVIQIAMGWEESHLHQFVLPVKRLTMSPEEQLKRIYEGTLDQPLIDRMAGRRVFVTKVTPWGNPIGMEGEDEEATTLAQVCPKVKSKLTYEYDFGDGWEHTIEVQKIFDPDPGVAYPVCLGGKKACPPEDCGGVWGYYEMLAALADPDHEQHEDMCDWLPEGFDPDAFDLKAVNATLARWRD